MTRVNVYLSSGALVTTLYPAGDPKSSSGECLYYRLLSGSRNCVPREHQRDAYRFLVVTLELGLMV